MPAIHQTAKHRPLRLSDLCMGRWSATYGRNRLSDTIPKLIPIQRHIGNMQDQSIDKCQNISDFNAEHIFHGGFETNFCSTVDRRYFFGISY